MIRVSPSCVVPPWLSGRPCPGHFVPPKPAPIPIHPPFVPVLPVEPQFVPVVVEGVGS